MLTKKLIADIVVLYKLSQKLLIFAILVGDLDAEHNERPTFL